MQVAFLRLFHANPWFSGAQLQALHTANALQALGIRVQFVEPDSLPEADLLHAFGLYPDYLSTVAVYRARGVPVVVSPIFFKDISRWWGRLRVHTAFLWEGRQRRYQQQRALLRQAHHLLPNTHAEAAQVQRYFRVDTPATVVPNGVDARFATADPRLFREQFGIKHDFVLCVGRIEWRKNQLRLIRALQGTGIPLVLIGQPISKRYLRHCERAAQRTPVLFLPPLPHDSPLLASAYAACRVFALPSLLETPGLAALEAGVAGARVVVTPYGGAPEYFRQFARYPNPRSVASLRATILEAWDAPHDADAQRHFLLSRYTWEHVAQQTLAVYRQVLDS